MSVVRVWKYVLRKPQQLVEMPAGARLLHVDQDPASLNPAVWAEVDPQADPQVRRLAVVMTGEAFDSEGLTYIGTAWIRELGIIAHVYEAAP